MPYSLRGSILSTTCRVLNLVENLTRSQKINCIFFKTAAWQRDFNFGATEKRDPWVPLMQGRGCRGGTEHLPVLVAPPHAKVWGSGTTAWKAGERGTFFPVLPSPGRCSPFAQLKWSQPAQFSCTWTASGSCCRRERRREHTNSVLCLIGKEKLPALHRGWDRLDSKTCISTVNY